MIAFILLALFSWVLLSLFWDIVPAPWIQADSPHKKAWGVLFLVVVGLLNYSFASHVMVWVWMGIRHFLGMDMEEL